MTRFQFISICALSILGAMCPWYFGREKMIERWLKKNGFSILREENDCFGGAHTLVVSKIMEDSTVWKAIGCRVDSNSNPPLLEEALPYFRDNDFKFEVAPTVVRPKQNQEYEDWLDIEIVQVGKSETVVIDRPFWL